MLVITDTFVAIPYSMLSDNITVHEIRVYATILMIGPATAELIAQRANMSVGSVKLVLLSLMKKGHATCEDSIYYCGVASENKDEVIVEKEDLAAQKVDDILLYWNSKKIIVHKKLIPKHSARINAAIKNYGVDTIKDAIDNYAVILKDKKYYFNYKWNLWDFCQRGIDKFVSQADPFNNFAIERDEIKRSLEDIYGKKPSSI